MSYPRAVVPLGTVLSACLVAVVHAQTPACDTLAVASDPVTSDSLYPPTLADVQIPSSGARMNGVLYLAQSKGPHTTVLVLHGFPGTEKNTDLAQVVRRAGFNALIFHYRGAWGSDGDYSFSHVLEDVAAALRWLRQPAVADSYRVNTRRLILVGHSLGGFAALYSAAADSGVRAVAALAPGDFGRRGEGLKDPEAFAASVRRLDPQLGPLRGTSGQALATRDAIVPLGEVYEPLGAALRQEGARHLTAATLDADHGFSNSRVRLARLLVRWLCSEQ